MKAPKLPIEKGGDSSPSLRSGQNDTLSVTLRALARRVSWGDSSVANAPSEWQERTEGILRHFVPQNDKKDAQNDKLWTTVCL